MCGYQQDTVISGSYLNSRPGNDNSNGIHGVLKLPCTFVLLQLAADWQRDNRVTVTNRRTVWSVEGTVTVIRQTESGIKMADGCWEFGLVNCAIQTVRQNGSKIISAFEQNGSRVKGFWKPERSDVDETLLKWFKQQISDTSVLYR